MIKILILFLLFVTEGWSSDRLELIFSQAEVNQGALLKGKLVLLPASLNFPVQKLKSQTIGETIYFHQLSPPMKKNGSSQFESDIQVIFIKPPESEIVTGIIENQPVQLSVTGLKVIPVESAEKMLWADFTAPDLFSGNWKWLWIGLALIILLPVVFFTWKKISARKKEVESRKKLIREFKTCSSYEDIVGMWKNKRVFLTEFPQIESDFRNFEETLFKYQFKSSQTADEKQLVVSAYQNLILKSEGGLSGV